MIPEQLIGLVRDIIRLRRDTSLEANKERELALEKIQIIGRTATFFQWLRWHEKTARHVLGDDMQPQ
ncbi:hypothetical protein HUK68_21325 (plasmid) [Comamonas antarctica]|uniref:Uncharacterized protein n=2 Tax=Comamonas antarctica TaxID=2743470 RepID=A0A6N1XC94_9BURK|nr:hypothetical protein HUK68_21325 [Comamonas antarctica]